MTAPSLAEYERMTEDLRRSALDVLREERALMHARMARLGDQVAAQGVAQTAVIAEAKALLPDVIAAHRDTPGTQARRRAALLDAVYGRRVA